MPQSFSLDEIAKHNTSASCWCIIHGHVYDLTAFLPNHPGGQGIILKYAGKDATAAFDPIHPSDVLDRFLPLEAHLGLVKGEQNATTVTKAHHQTMNVPSLSEMLNLSDFERLAQKVLSKEAWAYYSSGGDDELTLQENHLAFHRIWLRPRVLVNVRHVNASTRLLAHECSLPIYITATALGKLGHPEGEVVLTRAAGTRHIPQMVSTLASCSFKDIMTNAKPDQSVWFQLYVNAGIELHLIHSVVSYPIPKPRVDKKITESLVRNAETLGAKGIFVTVDAPQLGRREKDMRVKFVDDAPDVQKDEDSNQMNRNEGAARAISTFIDSSLSWKDIPWLMSLSRLPFFIKGIQTGEDAVLAAKMGVRGIVVSNHGGRQLDTVRSGIEVLEEVMDALHAAGYDKKLDVFVDGGFRRGTDIFKALALGAKAVGLGRPFLYAMSGYGQAGVERAIDLLKDEFEMVMRLMGVTRLEDISRSHIITKSLGVHAGLAPVDVNQNLSKL